MLDDKKWVKLNNFPRSIFQIGEVFEINNVLYIVGYEGISTLKNEFYKFPSNKFYCRSSCRIGNNILVISCNKIKSKLFNKITKQWSNVNVRTKRKDFDVVHYLNKVWILGGREPYSDRTFCFSDAENTIKIFDPHNKTEELSPIKMIQARTAFKVIVYNNKLFVFG